jgi:small subunit ribosomal protein S20
MKSQSAVKRHRQSERRKVRKQAARTRVRRAIKDVRRAAAGTDVPTAEAKLRAAERLIGKAVTKGTVHRNAAARYLSRLTRSVNAQRAKS